MTKYERALLVSQATKLYFLGLRVERARGRVKRLRERGVPSSHSRMLESVRRFQSSSNAWRNLERKHTALRKRLTGFS